VVSCMQCNNLKASRPLEDFLNNPYGLFPSPTVPTRYYIMPAALLSFVHIMKTDYTLREMYYYLLRECLDVAYNARQGLVYYLTPKAIFTCDQLYIRAVAPATMWSRMRHGFGMGLNAPEGHALFFTPTLDTAEAYRKYAQGTYQGTSLNVITRKLNNHLLYDTYHVCNLFGKTWVYTDNYVMMLRNRTIMEYNEEPKELPFWVKALSRQRTTPLAQTLLQRVIVASDVARAFDSPTEKGEDRIRKMLIDGRMYKWQDGRVVFRSNVYLFSLDNDTITSFGLREAETASPLRPSRHRRRGGTKFR